MNELFTIPETKSPRLLWMERHHLTIEDRGDGIPLHAIGRRYKAILGIKTIGYGASINDALVSAAKSLNVKLWNES